MSTKLSDGTALRKLKTFWSEELVWLAPSIVASTFVFLFYLASHPYPSFGAGLFLQISEQISENGYMLPETIAYYTPRGVPFAYPPLAFYLAAILEDVFGVDPLTISRFLPGIASTLYLVPIYLIARELLRDRPQASFATVVVAVSPPVLQWHISAGGMVRALAFLFAISGIYTGLKLFRTGERRWLAPSLGLFALTVLSHPLYTAFFVMSYLLMWATFDRSVGGLVAGAVVGFGGVALTTPWWLQVVSYHGPGVFSAAAGTHGGLGSGVHEFVTTIGQKFGHIGIEALWNLIPLAGAAYLIRERRYFIPVWLLSATVVLSKPRFLFLIGGLATAPLLFEVVAPALARKLPSSVGGRRPHLDNRRITVLSIALVVTLGMGAGTLYATSQLDSHAGSPSLPQFVDDQDMAAMQWAKANTAPSDSFVVMGDAAEWFPYFAERTMLIGPWGVEWEDSTEYQNQLGLYKELSACTDEACLTQKIDQAGVNPQYVYVPKDGFTVRGNQKQSSEQLRTELRQSGSYELAFENEGVLIFKTGGAADIASGASG